MSVHPPPQSSVRPDVGLASPGAATTGKSATPLYSFTAANPRRRSLPDPLPVGQSPFRILICLRQCRYKRELLATFSYSHDQNSINILKQRFLNLGFGPKMGRGPVFIGLPTGGLECITMLTCELIFLIKEENMVLVLRVNKILHTVLYSCIFWSDL